MKGITLVALVVTVVVLLILGGVSISLVLGQNGIITKAQEGGKQYKEASINEQVLLNDVAAYLSKAAADKLPTTDKTTPYLPDSTFFKVEGTDLNNGLVIQDNKDNQYVWIEVPKDTTSVYKTAINQTDYTNIEVDLQNYTSLYRAAGWDDIWYDGCGIATEIEYNNLKNRMLESIYKNGGFWIGRYESGLDNIRTVDTAIFEEIKIQKNAYHYNYITCSDAQKQVTTLSDGKNYKTSLLFGIQWDLVMKFLELKGMSQSDIKTNSATWGNYKNSTFDVTDIDARYSTNEKEYIQVTGIYTKPANSTIILTTGAVARNMYMNIYDLAGSSFEFTLEHSNSISDPCTRRGGSRRKY